MKCLDVDVWSDIACPWCYVGKRRLESARASFAHPERVRVRWRAFELDPAAPRSAGEMGPYAERLAKKYGMSRAEGEKRLRHLTELAAIEGLELRFDRIRPTNTFDAHRLVALARTRGVEDLAQERLMRAYFTDGLAVADPGVLAGLGDEMGLDRNDVHDVLASDAYSGEVRRDEDRARQLGISGVPFFMLGQHLAVSGAQPSSTLAAALEEAWTDPPGAAPPEGLTPSTH
ncbi:MAG: DsbA family oxidoreductase [Polyangiaceae bacterium]|jgi:predicted DsbA family dithiol-disulfide isomerase